MALPAVAAFFQLVRKRFPSLRAINLRAPQEKALQILLEGEDCLAILATGSGKSLIYAVYPLIMEEVFKIEDHNPH
jgi:superfamily II DNA helicase RecQ